MLKNFNAVLHAIVVCILIVTLLSSCSGEYWRETRSTGIERYGYNRPGWPNDHTCSTYYTRQPVKNSYMNRLNFKGRHIKQ